MSSDPTQLERLFVYGTLKSDLGNNHLLDGCERIGEGWLEGFEMWECEIPYVCPSTDPASRVYGEIWGITKDRIENQIDRLEGHPDFYKRTRVPDQCGGVWVYLFGDFDRTICSKVESGVFGDGHLSQKSTLLYFAYGKNMDPEVMAERTGCDVRRRKRAMLPGYELRFNKQAASPEGAGYANIEPCKDATVEGVLYQISERHLQILDIFEGHPDHYDRNPDRNGDPMPGVAVYVARTELLSQGLKPTREYLDHLLVAGADILGEQRLLSDKYVQMLRKVEALDD